MATLLKNVRAVDPQVDLDGIVDVLIDGTAIKEVGAGLACDDAVTLDCTGKVLVPGLVDVHVHFRDPGYEYKETVETGSRAAAHGGFTAVSPMANTNPVVDDGSKVAALVEKGRSAWCRIHPIGACTKGLKGEELAEMGDMVRFGAVAFSDDGRGVQDTGMMRLVMDYAKMFGKVVMCHEQDEALVGKGQVDEGTASTRLGLAPWPAAGEEIAIARDIELCRLTGCRLHVQHVSTARGAALVQAAKADGLPVTAEVTPHHLFLNEDMIGEDYNTNLKMNPPLRTQGDCDALADALLDGTFDCIATDHAPHAAHEKALEFEHAPFGTTGIETVLPLVLTNLVATGRMSWQRLVEAMAIAPRRILGVEEVRIEPGSTADLTVIDPLAPVEVTEGWFESRSTNSAFIGAQLIGKATEVLVGGAFTLKGGEVVEQFAGAGFDSASELG